MMQNGDLEHVIENAQRLRLSRSSPLGLTFASCNMVLRLVSRLRGDVDIEVPAMNSAKQQRVILHCQMVVNSSCMYQVVRISRCN